MSDAGERGPEAMSPWYHGLMDTTAFMLVVLGVPATCVAMVLFVLGHRLTLQVAVESGLWMIVIELAAAGLLYFAARRLSSRAK
jgi:ABC-type uncharacterized transport system permease subunit